MKKGILAAAVVAVLAVIVVGAMLFMRSSGSSIEADLKYLPNDCVVIASTRMGDVLKSQAYKDMVAEIAKKDPQNADPSKEFEQNTGVALTDIVRATVGGSEKEDMLTVVLTTGKAVSAADLASKMKKKEINFANNKIEEKWEARKFKEVKVGGYTLYEEEGDDKMGFCVAEPTRVVYGKTGAVKKVLERNQKAELTPAMKAALDLPDQSRTAFVAINLKGVLSGMGKGGNPFGDMAQGADKVEAVALDAAIASDAQLNVLALCKDAKDAEEVKKMVDGLLQFAKLMAGGQMPPDVTKTLDSIKIENKGNRVLGSATVKASSLVGALSMGESSKKEFKVTGEKLGDLPPSKEKE